MSAGKCNHSGVHCKYRVLVVEDDVELRKLQVTDLDGAGYEAVEATGIEQELLVDAIGKAQEHRCHLALVDMRLFGSTSTDTEGLNLVPELKPTESIIVTGENKNARTVVIALKEKGAAGFVEKEDGFPAVQEAMIKTLEGTCNCLLSIGWPDGYDPKQILRKLELNVSKVPEDELCCIVAHLYTRKQGESTPVAHIELESISAHYHSSEGTSTSSHSLILVARPRGPKFEQWYQGEIIKIAPEGRIREEITRFETYVKLRLPQLRTARIEHEPAILWDLGAIRYTNVATEDRRPLRKWYHDDNVDTDKVNKALNDLFKKTLGPWYGPDSKPQDAEIHDYGTIYNYYLSVFSNLGSRIDEWGPNPRELYVGGVPHKLRNPVSWAERHKDQSRFIPKWKYVHGDLHSENVFVDDQSRTYLIDYERSGPGFYLRDFVQLEADIRLHLLPLTVGELHLAFQLDLMLLGPTKPPTEAEHQPRWQPLSSANEEATKGQIRRAFASIAELRTLAMESVHFEEMDEYYWALLMETLFSVTRDYSGWEDKQQAELTRERAILSAALICERLARWRDPWPPAGWRQ